MLIEYFSTMKKAIIPLIVLFLLPHFIKASPEDSAYYDIKIKITGIKTAKVVLGYYLGEQTFAVDTAQVDTSTGDIRFKTTRKLAQGVYFVAHTEGVVFNLILATETDFSISTNISAPYDSAKIKHSVENAVYFNYMKAVQKVQNDISQIDGVTDMLRQAKADQSVINAQQQKITARYAGLDKYTQSVIRQAPHLFTSKLLNISTMPIVPTELTQLKNDKPNPAYWFYFRKHFFDGVDFTDKRLVRSPYYANRLGQFLGYMVNNTDSVKAELDFLLNKTQPNTEFYKFTLKWLTAVFDDNMDRMPNADAYLIHLVEKYHRKADSGTDKYTLERMEYKVNAFKNVLIGRPAPNFSLPNTEGVLKSLGDVKADYVLVIFYSSLCSHCREAMPTIQNALQKMDSKKLKVFSVCTDGVRESWLPFLEEMKMKDWVNVIDKQPDTDIQKKYVTWNLPVLYLLDKNKTILANRIKPENLPSLMANGEW
jgi:thiol-disulfide isomerase/thioredoxin